VTGVSIGAPGCWAAKASAFLRASSRVIGLALADNTVSSDIKQKVNSLISDFCAKLAIIRETSKYLYDNSRKMIIFAAVRTIKL
jgi:hypothetical protein